MTKEIAFLIWLYDREIEHRMDDCEDWADESNIIRSKFTEFFGIDADYVFEHSKNG